MYIIWDAMKIIKEQCKGKECYDCKFCRFLYKNRGVAPMDWETYDIFKEEKETLYKIQDIVKFSYGTKFENIETGTIYIIEQQLKILKSNGEYDYPALSKDSFEENYRIIRE